METMTIEQYSEEYRQINAWRKAGLLTYGESLDRHFDLNRRYLRGRRSWILPVVA
jgi:hypothetical protein